MTPFCVMLRTICLHLLLHFALWFGPKTARASASGNETDHLALLKFKKSISDPYGILDTWNDSTHFCSWHGIKCSPKHQRVVVLKIQGFKLRGIIPPQIGNLSFLRIIDLENNSFYGNIPQELGHLLQLQVLYLNNNSFTGQIPKNLSSCSQLTHFDLSVNNMVGKIPTEIASFWKLRELFVNKNNFTGQIPPSVGNFSSLFALNLQINNLEGNIPQEICRMKNLMYLVIDVNEFSGAFPSCVYNMSSLIVISAAANKFNGSLPRNMFSTLPNLQVFQIGGGSNISGPIPSSITNTTSVRLFDIRGNRFFGQVPSLGNLKDLYFLNLEGNYLGGNSTKDLEFLKSLANCSKLYVLAISINNFGGRLPDSIGNLSNHLSYLFLGSNQMYGKIPAEIGKLTNLTFLDMRDNQFDGIVPATFGKFQNMHVLLLKGNKLSGDMSPFIGNFSQLFALDLSHNRLEGNIPSSIANCPMLQSINLSQNNFGGSIPLEVFKLPSLTISLDLSHNSFNGSLPNEVSWLKQVEIMDVSENRLTGDIPASIGECKSLEYLYLQGNFLHGIIPTSLASLKGLQYLDLSRNHLSGSIPDVLQNISSLEYLNVSFNMLGGEVPMKGVFQNASKLAVTGNSKLCGGISELHLPPCPIISKKHTKHHNFRLIAVLVTVISFLLILLFTLTIYWMRKGNKKLPANSPSPTIDLLPKVSYQNLHHGTDGFSTINLIGSGSFGYVYKGTIGSEDRVVAIKVLNLQKKGAHKSFIAECNALRNIRHRNLVEILTCCSGIDYKGQDFKALVFEYMKNGSLEQWLHPSTRSVEQPRRLDLHQRINIIIDVASALHYLHYECEQLIIHCDLKPSNVLLDDDLVAHVSDFGLAKLVSTIDGASHMQTSTSGIKGTVGYAPPEYGVSSEMSVYGDLYSFGILMLEMLTGRRPTDEMFKDGQNLHSFVEALFPNNLLHILDPQLVLRNEEAILEEENNRNLNPNAEKCLVSLFSVGLACSVESPKERMSMIDVVRELNGIRKAFFAGVDTCENQT